ncbi:MAG TPA: alpha/beta hydrolase, partial [Sphingomonadaceae bacterium]|nr:alpha/beta hydrolase [Sphingomonadaceae bacterium]
MADSVPFVRDDVRAFLTMLEGLNRPDISEVPLSETRAMMAAMQEFAQVPPREIALVEDLACPGPAGEIPLRLYDPRGMRGPSPLLVFIHGGGFVAGSVESYHRFCTLVAAEMDLPLVSVEYRLAPEHPFPAAPDDCEAAARWLAASPPGLGFAVTGLIPLGDSAGGNMALVLEQALRAAPAGVPVIMQVPIYPICDDFRQHPSSRELGEGYMLTDSVMDFFEDCYRADKSSAKLYPILGELAGTAPTVLL